MATSSLAIPQTDAEKAALAETLRCRWTLHARPNQLPPDNDWRIWLIKTGRGWGKTRTAGEWVRAQVESGKCKRLHLVAATAADARDTMVEGESGILAISPVWCMPNYEPSKRRLTWPNGAVATLFSAEEPDRLRGPQCDGWWADELAAWKYIEETWDQLQFGARLGNPRGVITTTPRPVKLLKDLVKDPEVTVISGHTLENRDNLAPAFLRRVEERYGGTRLGRQELAGEILDDNPNALWRRDWIDRDRITTGIPSDMRIVRIVVGLDPSATATGDEAGIIVAAVDGQDTPHYYVLDDASMQGTPEQWARGAVQSYYRHNADRLIYERNQGGEMVRVTIRTVDHKVRIRDVWASRGKQTRAEPISALYEQKRVHHVGNFPQLEDEMCEWQPSDPESPNRMDALVWALSELSGRKPSAMNFDRKAVGL